jgi:hypothetical protein
MKVFRLWGEHVHRVAGRGPATLMSACILATCSWSDQKRKQHQLHQHSSSSSIPALIYRKEIFEILDYDSIAGVHESVRFQYSTMNAHPTPRTSKNSSLQHDICGAKVSEFICAGLSNMDCVALSRFGYDIYSALSQE